MLFIRKKDNNFNNNDIKNNKLPSIFKNSFYLFFFFNTFPSLKP